jgi:hypothetical protein
LERAGGISDTLGVIAAGVGDNAALALVIREGSDFVVGSAEFEGADGLLVFGLEEEARAAVDSRGRLSPHVLWELDQVGACGDAL